MTITLIADLYDQLISVLFLLTIFIHHDSQSVNHIDDVNIATLLGNKYLSIQPIVFTFRIIPDGYNNDFK